jgi:dTDP-4-dehydrorhamnose reductase
MILYTSNNLTYFKEGMIKAMKILITGANGMLAKEVKEKFEKENELILTDVAELDITNEEMVRNFVKKEKPECIINCAAFTAVDRAETAGEIVEKINAKGPGNLAKAAKENNSVLVHISTDYVFGGDLDVEKDYKEEDKKNPVTAYGITKLHGEEQIAENTDKYYIFRTAWLYGIGGNNFVKTMLKLGESKDELNVVADQHGSPTYAKDLAQMIYQAVQNKIPYGIYHATNEGYTTWYDFTKAIFEYTKTDCKVNPVTTEEYIEMMKITQAKRPFNSQLSKEKIKAQGINVPQWEDGLKRYLKEEGRI